MKATTTVNPLHFEDLEPRRFEDLVRQLIYDFKEWKSLEATGRSGSDEGFDVRGTEKLYSNDEEDDNHEDSENLPQVSDSRIWLIQCKREKRIGPADIKRYVGEIKAKEKIDGILFVGACDFSKKTRDAFSSAIREKGFLEGHLWGKAELEDMLFQPKNDHLLFGFFGVSLVTQRRTAKARISSKLTIKRKLVKVFGDVNNQPTRCNVLLRDINDTAYPYKDYVKGFEKNPPWRLCSFSKHNHAGITVLIREYYAYSNNETQEWDVYEKEFGAGIIGEDPWDKEVEKKTRIHDYWYYKLPEANRAFLRIYACVRHDRIVAVDEMGDAITNMHGQICPHLYVTFQPENGPYDNWRVQFIEPTNRFGGEDYVPNKTKRIKYFPDSLPEISQEEKEREFKRLTGLQ